jgi:hypothetical protein
VRAEQASVNVSIENSISTGNNFGFESTGGSIRIANCGIYNNNANLTTNIGSLGDNRNARNTTTNAPTVPGGFTVN